MYLLRQLQSLVLTLCCRWTTWQQTPAVAWGTATSLVDSEQYSVRVQKATSDELAPPSVIPCHSVSIGLETHTLYNCIHRAFIDQASRHPQQNAVVDHFGNCIDYAELDALSMHLATILHQRGVNRGSRVCLLVERSISFIISIMAVLRLGAAYIPLNGSIMTEASLCSVLNDAHPTYTLISRKHMDLAKHISFPKDCLEDWISEWTRSSVSRNGITDDVEPFDSAYIIFTSGTTGRPKGVVISHLSMTNLLCQTSGNLGIGPGVRVAQVMNVAFDMCAWEILATLMNGGTLYLRGPHRMDWIEVWKTAHVVICTPSILAQHEPADYPNIRVIVTAGEPCSQALADKWSVNAAFYNCCGPTEVTIVNTMHRHELGQTLTIGKPTPNNAIYVLDDNLNPVPKGVPGKMWAAGLGICKGYLERPDLNHRKFRQDIFFQTGRLMYDTGDIGRCRENGELEHLGRADDQVKIKVQQKCNGVHLIAEEPGQGFRVELDGVSAAMCTCSGITAACALLVGQQLYRFYCPADVASNVLHEEMTKIQPYYAVPAVFVGLACLPLTSNGKIDKHHLREMVVYAQ